VVRIPERIVIWSIIGIVCKVMDLRVVKVIAFILRVLPMIIIGLLQMRGLLLVLL